MLFPEVAVRADEGPPPLLTEAQQVELFESRIRPLLVEKCQSCHGPDKQLSGLRLDSREALLKGSENGPVVISGDPSASRLLEVVGYEGDVKMPPDERLPGEAIEGLRAWIAAGVHWPAPAADSSREGWRSHWAFQPVRRPAAPAVRQLDWGQTSIDPFILAELERRDLTPSPRAEKATLLRRASFDLLGLAPTIAEIRDFEGDDSPWAFAKVVDRLLASEHYGERWGRYWLDVARYADTKGYVFFQEDSFPWSWTYRDYVIRAFNEDLPYDQFILDQLAGDQIHATGDQRALAGMGFLTLGARFMNNQQDILDDRIDVVTRGLLGLTVSCARCHDHKFDPIPSADYYSLYGVFANSFEPTVPPLFEPTPQTEEYAKFSQELADRERKLREFVEAKHAEVVGGARTRAGEYMLAAWQASRQPDTEQFMLLADGGDLNPKMLHRWQVFLKKAARRKDAAFVLWHALGELPEQDFETRAAALLAEWTAAPDAKTAHNPRVLQSLVAAPPKTMAQVAERYGQLLKEVDQHWQAALAQSAAQAGGVPTALVDAAEEELRQALYGPDSPASLPMNPMGDLALLPDRPAQAQLQELLKAVETWRATGPGAPPRAMVLEDAQDLVEQRIFLRGSPAHLGDPVPRQFLGLLAREGRQPFTRGSGRLELAQAIVDPANVLTARVLVNRVWAHHFGQGLVRTPSDFGLRSDPPTHPDLLDHLAHTLVDSGWSIKELHRRILLSSTWQQASHDWPDGLAADPENTWLWKMNRRRLDFEATRDAILSAAGRMDWALGGASVSLLENAPRQRRTVYGLIDRLNLPGLFRTFDFPSPDATSAQRSETTVPPQALYLWNNPLVLDSAQAILDLSAVAGQTELSAKLRAIHSQIYGREASDDEIALAVEFLGPAGEVPTRLVEYVQVLLLANELVFVD